jgi:hypothetical protein
VEISLAAAVASVRDELLDAAGQGAGAEVRFAVNEIALEFEVVLREDKGRKAGFAAWVVAGGMSSSKGHADTHRVSLKLSPLTAGGGEVWIAGDPARAEGPGDVAERIGR